MTSPLYTRWLARERWSVLTAAGSLVFSLAAQAAFAQRIESAPPTPSIHEQEAIEDSASVPPASGHVARRYAFTLPDAAIAPAGAQSLLLIAPGPTRYEPRSSSPLELRLPAAAPAWQPRSFVHARAEDGPLGALGFMLVLPGEREALAWGHLDGWRGLAANRNHAAADLGWRGASGGAPVALRMGIDADGNAESWNTESSAREGQMRWLRSLAFIEKRGALLEEPVVWTGEAHGGFARTRYRVDDERRTVESSWLGINGGVTAGARQDSSVSGARSGLEVDVTGGIAIRDDSFSSGTARGRWLMGAGWRMPLAGGSLLAGVSGGGEGGGDGKQLLAPRIAWRLNGQDEGVSVRAEIGARILFPDVIERRGEEGPDHLRNVRGVDPRSPTSPAILNFSLPPQREWPRVALGLERRWKGGSIDWSLDVARWRDPLDLRPLSGTAAPVIYITSSSQPRWVTQSVIGGDWRIGRDLALRAQYCWTHDDIRTADRLLFLPAHDLAAAATLEHSALFGELSAHLRSSTVAGPHGEHTPVWVSFSARAGVRLGSGSLALSIENLFAEQIVIRPDEIYGERRFGLEWNHSFSAHTP